MNSIEGRDARIDHLEGILFTDRILDQQSIMRSEWEKL